MSFNHEPTELTTAATDLVLGVLAIACVVYLAQFRAADPWKVVVWSSVFFLLASSAFLGAIVHGIEMTPQRRHLLWQPLFLLLGLTVALFVVGAVHDWAGARVAKRMVPVMVLLAVVFYLITRAASGGFWVFILYEVLAMLFALIVYGLLSLKSSSDGMPLMAVGIGLNIVAAAVQTTRSVSFRLIWPFDHNGTFHLLQIVAVVVLVAGLVQSLQSTVQAVEP